MSNIKSLARFWVRGYRAWVKECFNGEVKTLHNLYLFFDSIKGEKKRVCLCSSARKMILDWMLNMNTHKLFLLVVQQPYAHNFTFDDVLKLLRLDTKSNAGLKKRMAQTDKKVERVRCYGIEENNYAMWTEITLKHKISKADRRQAKILERFEGKHPLILEYMNHFNHLVKLPKNYHNWSRVENKESQRSNFWVPDTQQDEEKLDVEFEFQMQEIKEQEEYDRCADSSSPNPYFDDDNCKNFQ